MTQLLDANGRSLALTFDQYQRAADTFALPSAQALEYLVPGLGGEVGEFQGKIAKIVRDKGGAIDPTDAMELLKELGDILWFVSGLASHMGVPLADVAKLNIEKLASRRQRGTIQGSGDNR